MSELTPRDIPRTALAEERVSDSHHYTPPYGLETHGQFKERPIIGRDTRINGGLYLGARGREAIVVDGVKHEYLEQAYQLLIHSISDRSSSRDSRRRRSPINLTTLLAIFDYTIQLLPYNPEAVRETRHRYPVDKKIALQTFIVKGGGVCRHQALLAGFFVERMIDDGLLPGEVHVERNETEAGAHAWVHYIPGDGPDYIIDPAQGFVGTQTEAAKSAYWNYKVPDE